VGKFSENDIILKNLRIEKSIGQGAFGEVYLATHLGLNGKRAVKVLLRDEVGIGSTEYDEYRNRFRQESQLMEWFNHPNIIRVYDFQEEENTLFLVMEYASGGSLRERMDEKKKNGTLFTVEETVKTGIEIAEGLAILHAKDIVHRDLKPSNILFDADGHAKVADLGLAQVPGGASMRSQLSIVKPHPGTPAYMSPEQEVAGSYLRPASDIYSLGLILFEMLTGRGYKSLRPGTRLKSLSPDSPDWLDDLLLQMFSDNPKDRPWDGDEVSNNIKLTPHLDTPLKEKGGTEKQSEKYSLQYKEKNISTISLKKLIIGFAICISILTVWFLINKSSSNTEWNGVIEITQSSINPISQTSTPSILAVDSQKSINFKEILIGKWTVKKVDMDHMNGRLQDFRENGNVEFYQNGTMTHDLYPNLGMDRRNYSIEGDILNFSSGNLFLNSWKVTTIGSSDYVKLSRNNDFREEVELVRNY
jgi:serine/threonine protein kinase